LELLIYSILIVLALLIQIRKNKIFEVSFVITLITFIFVVRYGKYELDMIKWKDWLSSTFWNFYAFREIGYFGTSRFLFMILKSRELTFLVLDLSLIIIILKGCKIESPQNYFRLTAILITSYPFLHGMQNLYRQHLAIGFLILAIALIKRKKYLYSTVLLIIGILYHNSIAIFVPLFWVFTSKNLFFKYVFASLIPAILFVLSVVLEIRVKSNAETGLNLSIAYLIMFGVLFFILITIFKFRFYNFEKSFGFSFWGFITISQLAMFLNSTPIERLSTILIMIIAIETFIYISKNVVRKQVIFAYLILNICLTIPTFLFKNAFQLLI